MAEQFGSPERTSIRTSTPPKAISAINAHVRPRPKTDISRFVASPMAPKPATNRAVAVPARCRRPTRPEVRCGVVRQCWGTRGADEQPEDGRSAMAVACARRQAQDRAGSETHEPMMKTKPHAAEAARAA